MNGAVDATGSRKVIDLKPGDTVTATLQRLDGGADRFIWIIEAPEGVDVLVRRSRPVLTDARR